MKSNGKYSVGLNVERLAVDLHVVEDGFFVRQVEVVLHVVRRDAAVLRRVFFLLGLFWFLHPQFYLVCTIMTGI